jgi:GAF domain-containing protein
MIPMKPIPETLAAIHALEPPPETGNLVAHLTRLANRAKELVPDLVGVSVARLDEGLTFTLVATAAEIAVLDAIQYSTGGPCVEGAETGEVRAFDNEDVLDESRWQLFAQATAAHTVRATLTLPILEDDRVLGTVNLYAASRGAFGDLHEELADIFGAWAAGAVTNADLAFTTRGEAQAAPRRVRERVVVEMAIGILASHLGLDVDAAEDRLRDAARRGGVSTTELAQEVVRIHERRQRGDD